MVHYGFLGGGDQQGLGKLLVVGGFIHLFCHRVDNLDNVVLSIANLIPHIVGDVDLLGEVVLELLTDGGEQQILLLGYGQSGSVNAHYQLIGFDAFQIQRHALVRLQA